MMASRPSELQLLQRTSDPRHYLSAESALLNYIRIADEIASLTQPGAAMLDWGCGHGQMSWLLQRRGLQVTSYDVGATESLGPSQLYPEITVRRGTDPIALPYPDQSFDAVLSCGVLEHVPYPAASVAEVQRILRPGGQFFIYNLPQLWSWPENLREVLRMGATHSRRFTLGDVQALMNGAGLRVRLARRTNMLPKHFTSLPPALRAGYGRLAPLNLWLDRRLSAVPGLNQMAGLLEIVAVKA